MTKFPVVEYVTSEVRGLLFQMYSLDTGKILT